MIYTVLNRNIGIETASTPADAVRRGGVKKCESGVVGWMGHGRWMGYTEWMGHAGWRLGTQMSWV